MLSDGGPVWPKQKQSPLSHPFFSYSIGSFLFGSKSFPHSALGHDPSPTTDPYWMDPMCSVCLFSCEQAISSSH